jgi:hypothetical protein
VSFPEANVHHRMLDTDVVFCSGSFIIRGVATVWGIITRLGLSLLGLVLAVVATLMVLMTMWPCITLFLVLSVVVATALVCRRRASDKRP